MRGNLLSQLNKAESKYPLKFNMPRLWIFMLFLLVILPNVRGVQDETLDVFMNEVKKLRKMFDEFKVTL